ncbi:MAG: hypothetical protein LAO79_15740 [Acidobacteriia bacterium]|nr:hypothetical protein [Terriglobia bacterium]
MKFAIFFLATTLLAAQSMEDKEKLLERNLIDKHLVDGLYVSIVPAGAPVVHTVDDPGNVIHAGVWTGRYLAGVAYQYAVTRDPAVRKHGGDLLMGLRRLQEVTGKPGLLARGYIKGHGPVEGFERGGADSKHWHQGQGKYADYRFYSDVSVDNFNAVLYGYAIYYDLAADAAQKKMIAYDVDRLMTHLLDNHFRIIDLNGHVTQYGHVGIDPDPSRDKYYQDGGDSEITRYITKPEWHPALRASLMALPDLLIAHHITGKQRYIDEYKKLTARFADNPEPARDTRPYSPERIARVNHSSEGQSYEALFNAIVYEKDPKLLAIYRRWLGELWDLNWMEGNPLYTFMTLALAPKLEHGDESLALSVETLRRYPTDRVLRPVMGSIRKDIEMSPFPDRGGAKQAVKPVPIDQRPLDNEYAWKGNPYATDGWLKPAVTSIQFACDDPLVSWFSDATGHAYMSRDGMKTWIDVSFGLVGAKVLHLAASKERTFVIYAETDRGIYVSRDGGMSWRGSEDKPAFAATDSDLPVQFDGWRIPVATWKIGSFAGGPGGVYRFENGRWSEAKFWREDETGAADYLHAYWMGRYYRFVK